MSQDAWNVGAEYQLASNTVVGVNYIHTDLNRTIEDVGNVVNGNEAYLFVQPGREPLFHGADNRGDRALPDPRGRSGNPTPSRCPSPAASPTTGPGWQLRPEPP